jgi:hypothetical protein
MLMSVRIDLSGLERLQRVLAKLDGSKTYRFSCERDGVLDKIDKRDLAVEAFQKVIADDRAQADFLANGSFSYESRLVDSTITVSLCT